MAALDFLRRNREVTVLHYNHGTGTYADKATELVSNYCRMNSIDCLIGRNTEIMPPGVSAEAWWRDRRYEWFNSVTNESIVMAHHLDDAVETWIFSSMHGTPRIIPSVRENYLRPFLTTRKEVFQKWCLRKNVPYVEDPSNLETKHMRNYIRHVLMPKALHVNPGLHKVIKKNILSTLK